MVKGPTVAGLQIGRARCGAVSDATPGILLHTIRPRSMAQCLDRYAGHLGARPGLSRQKLSSGGAKANDNGNGWYGVEENFHSSSKHSPWPALRGLALDSRYPRSHGVVSDSALVVLISPTPARRFPLHVADAQ